MIPISRFKVYTIVVLTLIASGNLTYAQNTPADGTGQTTSIVLTHLENARQLAKDGVAAGEMEQFVVAVRGGPKFAKARKVYAALIDEMKAAKLEANYPKAAAQILGENAWFALRVDGAIDDAIYKLNDAVKLDPDNAVLHYKLGVAENEKHAIRSPNDEVLEKSAVDQLEFAHQLDPLMPEVYRARVLMTPPPEDNSKSREERLTKIRADYADFLKYSSRISPELFFYQEKLIEGTEADVKKFLDATAATSHPAQ